MPAVPILTIPVDASQFEAFTKLFGQYADELGKTDTDWKKAADAIHQASGTRVRSNLQQVNRALTTQRNEVRSTNRGMQALRGTWHDIGGAIHKAHGFLHALARETAKWTLGIGTAVTLFDRLGASSVNRINAARAVNSTSGRLGAFQTAARAFGFGVENLPASILAGVTSRQNNLVGTVLAPLLGMTPLQMEHHTVESSQRLMMFAHNFMRAHRNQSPFTVQSLPTVQAMEQAGLSFQQLTMFGNTPTRDIVAMNQLARINAQRQQLQAGTLLDFARFRVELGNAGRSLETDLANRLHVLGPALGHDIDMVAKAFQTLFDHALSKSNLDAITQGLVKFADFVGSGAFLADLRKLGDAIGRAATFLQGVVNAIVGTPASAPHGTHAGHGATGLFGGMTPQQNEALNLSQWRQQSAVRREFGGGTGTDGFLNALKGDSAFSAQVFSLPSVQARFAAFERANGLPAGTLMADARAESGANLFATNSGAAGAFQMRAPARIRFGVGNPFDPLQEGRGAAAQLAQDLATARALLPVGTMLQHLQMMKAANAMGDQGFIRFYQREVAHGRSNEWLRDAPGWVRADVGRFIHDRASADVRRLESANAAGQIDTGVSTAAQMRTARSDMAAVARTATAHLASIDRKVGHMHVTVTTTTPLVARVANQANAVQ